MPFRLIPYLTTINFFVQFVHPAWRSIRTACYKDSGTLSASTDQIEQDVNLVQWTIYWILYIFYTWLENTVLYFCISYLPFYGELKLALFCWLTLPQFQGAAWLWYAWGEKYFAILDEVIIDFLETRTQSVMTFALGHGKSEPAISKQAKFVNSRTVTPVAAQSIPTGHSAPQATPTPPLSDVS